MEWLFDCPIYGASLPRGSEKEKAHVTNKIKPLLG